MPTKPEISIVCPSFNHEAFIADYIESILAQTYQNFELIIVDDCSTDKNVDVIKSFNDKRIKLIQHDYNKGMNASLNTAFQNSCGNIIIILASDDIMEPFALQKYKEAFSDPQIGVAYTNLTVIDENNELRKDFENSCMPLLPIDSNSGYLWKLFYIGNILYSPGMAMSRKIMQKIYPLSPASTNYQDYKMHVEILSCTKSVILQDKLVRYRIIRDSKSLSAQSFATTMRCELEEDSLMDSFLKIQDVDLLKEIFEKEIAKTGIIPYPETIKFFLGYMALLSDKKTRKIWGYHKIMEFYNENLQNDILKKKYNFIFKDLLGLVNYFKVPEVVAPVKKIKLKPLELIFSLKNLPDKKHKQICILGCKLKTKRN